MRNVLISLAVATSALAVAAPAAAQYGAPPPPGYAYGYNNYGITRALQVRIDALQRHITHLDRVRAITNREARSLREESRAVERRLRETSRRGLNPRERHAVEIRIARLEQRIQREMRDGNRWGYNQYGNNGWIDRDRDGRDDRYEDDRGTRHD